MIVFIDHNIKVGNGGGRQHPHGYTTDLVIDQIAKSHAVIFHHHFHCFLHRFTVIVIPSFGKEG